MDPDEGGGAPPLRRSRRNQNLSPSPPTSNQTNDTPIEPSEASSSQYNLPAIAAQSSYNHTTPSIQHRNHILLPLLPDSNTTATDPPEDLSSVPPASIVPHQSRVSTHTPNQNIPPPQIQVKPFFPTPFQSPTK